MSSVRILLLFSHERPWWSFHSVILMNFRYEHSHRIPLVSCLSIKKNYQSHGGLSREVPQTDTKSVCPTKWATQHIRDSLMLFKGRESLCKPAYVNCFPQLLGSIWWNLTHSFTISVHICSTFVNNEVETLADLMSTKPIIEPLGNPQNTIWTKYTDDAFVQNLDSWRSQNAIFARRRRENRHLNDNDCDKEVYVVAASSITFGRRPEMSEIDSSQFAQVVAWWK